VLILIQITRSVLFACNSNINCNYFTVQKTQKIRSNVLACFFVCYFAPLSMGQLIAWRVTNYGANGRLLACFFASLSMGTLVEEGRFEVIDTPGLSG